MNDVLKVGIIGCGGIARSHLEAIAQSDAIQAVAMGDNLAQRAEAYAKEFGAEKAYSDTAQLLADPNVQAVHVCLPHDLHHAVCIAAANAGKHILVEKPIALKSTDAEEMMAAADANNVRFMVGHVLRFREVNIQARRIIADGKIGQPVSVVRRRMGYCRHDTLPAWHADPKHMGNFAIYGFGTHEVDTILWTLDTEAKRAFSAGRVAAPVWGNEDEVSTILELANGAIASYTQSLNARQGAHDCIYIGTEGSLSVGHTQLDLNGKIIEVEPDGGHGMAAQIHEFARACLEEREPLSSARDCMRTQRTLDAMWRSVQTGQVVEVQGS
jgi:predicted dehydrogenase